MILRDLLPALIRRNVGRTPTLNDPVFVQLPGGGALYPVDQVQLGPGRNIIITVKLPEDKP